MTASERQAASQPDTTGVTWWGRAARFERGIYTNIYRWIRRRGDTGGEGSVALAYVDLVRTTIWIWIGASALEMAVVHFLVPWPWVRWPLLVVSIWGLVWMFGLLGGLIVHPHLVEPTRLRVRNGHTIDAVIPVERIAGVRSFVSSMPTSRTVQVGVDDPDHLFIAVSGQVNVHVSLDEAIDVALPAGRYRVTAISFWADDSTAAVQAIKGMLDSDPR